MLSDGKTFLNYGKIAAAINSTSCMVPLAFGASHRISTQQLPLPPVAKKRHVEEKSQEPHLSCYYTFASKIHQVAARN